MGKARVGSQAARLFSKEAAPARSTSRLGRPPAARPGEQITTSIYADQVLALDRTCLDLRGGNGWRATRAELLRALVDGFLKSKPDLSAVRSETDLANLVGSRLKG